MIVVHPTVSEINTMIFVWVLTWLHFKFHSEIVFQNFTNLVFDIQRVNIEWNLNSDADYTGNIVDRKITSGTWLIFETFICCIDFSKKISAYFSLEIIFQIVKFFSYNPFEKIIVWPYFQISHFYLILNDKFWLIRLPTNYQKDK